MKNSVIIAGCLLAISAFAADDWLVKKGTEQVSAARQEVGILIRDLQQGMNPGNTVQRLSQIQRRLQAAEKSLFDSLSGYDPITPLPPIEPLPGYGRIVMSAKCEIDDDPQFDPGQMSGGILKGTSIQNILSDCEAIARASGSAQYSYGISEIKIENKPVDAVQATCEIDDDPQFDPGQISIGDLAGRDFLEVMNQCKLIASARYGANGSAGIKNPVIEVRHFLVSADCHLDDDPQFDEGQVIFGKIGANSITDAINQCAGIAKAIYGQNGSSGLRNIVQR